ncbi:DUF5641 domain-containing protein [Trichonephila inaurata madagascariensis]|uniref:DUF5641 domain-containing protein n=1 Tax=Trichonephila inaurata madagascariensis TaxID=2747483 RepID=A0A8X7C3E1_9ARAC|nr:DUF5641 domain-containing protein [Trichonephila inaurata madagascariensis]
MSPTQVRTISDYILLSVTYGAACASFLAIRTVHQSSIDYAFQFLTASRLYFCNFCVDNLLIGAHSVQKATQFVDDLKRILAKGGYTIRKRASNCSIGSRKSSGGAQRLEAVSDHSAQTLLAALKRFVARRGIPSDVCSDRGKNFKGIANRLKQIFQILRSEEIHNFRNSEPPSPDPSDVRAFTPEHFLTGVPLFDLPDGASSTNLRLPFRWNWLQQIKQVFWKRWSRDYLHHLQSRPKRYSQGINLQVGDWVVIHDILIRPFYFAKLVT